MVSRGGGLSRKRTFWSSKKEAVHMDILVNALHKEALIFQLKESGGVANQEHLYVLEVPMDDVEVVDVEEAALNAAFFTYKSLIETQFQGHGKNIIDIINNRVLNIDWTEEAKAFSSRWWATTIFTSTRTTRRHSLRMSSRRPSRPTRRLKPSSFPRATQSSSASLSISSS